MKAFPATAAASGGPTAAASALMSCDLLIGKVCAPLLLLGSGRKAVKAGSSAFPAETDGASISEVSPHRARLSQIVIAKAAAASAPASAANQAATSTDSFAAAMCWGRSASASMSWSALSAR
jgi:hypothetical protein